MKKTKKAAVLLSTLLLILFSSCHKKKNLDKILYNGKIYLVDNNFNMVDAIAIDKGKIKETGLKDDILDDFQAKEFIDLKPVVVPLESAMVGTSATQSERNA